MRFFLSFCMILCLLISPAVAADPDLTDDAQKIFKNHGTAIYQIKVVDESSGKKSSIGSGFQFTADGHIATNYHVVAEAIQRPEQYRVEFVDEAGETGPLEILSADVVHDIAIVRRESGEGANHLALGSSSLPKGTRLFALGNPHDIVFTIIEGTYNGLMEKSMYDKIHFSGSLNPGMSGGPALDREGSVIGINVMTAGNQISFLVPVEFLETLYSSWQALQGTDSDGGTGGDFVSKAEEFLDFQLYENQKHYMEKILAEDWETVRFSLLEAPGEVSDVFKCWTDQNNEEEDKYKRQYFFCSSQDRLFLDDNFFTGPIYYRYRLISVEPDSMPLSRFYSLYESQFRRPMEVYYNAGERDVENFKCETEFVTLAARPWKVATCVRRYKKYPRLHDVQVTGALLGLTSYQGLTFTLALQGVGQTQSEAFIQKFLSRISWADDGMAEQEGGL